MKIFALLLSILDLVASAVDDKEARCDLPHSKDGIKTLSCQGYFVKWSYRGNTNDCVQFIYGGCAGNDNRFDSQEECENICKN